MYKKYKSNILSGQKKKSLSGIFGWTIFSFDYSVDQTVSSDPAELELNPLLDFCFSFGR